MNVWNLNFYFYLCLRFLLMHLFYRKTLYNSVRNMKHRKILAKGFHLDYHFTSRLTEYLFPLFQIFGKNVEIIESWGWVKIKRKSSKFPISIRSPHLALNLIKSGSLRQIGNSIGHHIIGAGRVIELPYFKYDFRPSGKFIDFEVKVKWMRPYKHISFLAKY